MAEDERKMKRLDYRGKMILAPMVKVIQSPVHNLSPCRLGPCPLASWPCDMAPTSSTARRS